jgi:hypothetical protein
VEDIFVYAAKCVDNKGVLARIGHSAKLHSLRSAAASKGSAASKAGALVGAGIRATVNAMPIPVIGGLIGALEQKVEKAIKSKMHGRSLQKATSVTEKVKFTLKELSVEELDRYRWKVSEAITEFNKLNGQKDVNLKKQQEAHATCETFLQLAMAAEQVNRRLLKLKTACLGIFAAIKITGEWIEDCQNGAGATPLTMEGGTRTAAANGGVSKTIAELKTWIAAAVQAELDLHTRAGTDAIKEAFITEYHGKCEKWCCFRAAGKPDNWANCKDNAAFVLRNLADPFVPDSFNNNLGVLWKED